MTASVAVGLRILDASVPAEREAWLSAWARCPGEEIMAHPDYVRLFARPGDKALAAVAETDRGGVLYPILLRPLAAEPWAEGERAWDLTNAYGYGGPFAWGVTPEEAEAFWDAFDAWATERGVATAFSRLSVFEDRLLPWRGERVLHGPVIVRALDLPEKELLRDYVQKTADQVRRYLRGGLEFDFDLDGRRLEEFMHLYGDTMDRRQASAFYRFPRSFFEALARDLRGRFAVASVSLRGEVVSCDLMLFSKEEVWGFLLGTRADALALHVNEYMRHRTFLRCRELGRKRYVLGGGYRPGDGILHFKRTFAPRGEMPFHLARRVYDAPAVERLVARRAAWERARGISWSPDPGFVPPYRA